MEKSPKPHLYHMVPENMIPDGEGRHILHPLNALKEKFPELYEVQAEKYSSSDERKILPSKLIPTLEKAAWGDVIQLTPIHPKDLKQALVEAGYDPKELRFYQVDPKLLDPQKTTIYLYREDVEDEAAENFAPYDAEKLAEHTLIPQHTREYYKEQRERGEKPLLFVGVPHIFHKGPIDVTDFPVITV